MTTKLAINNLYKVFGSHPAEAIRRAERGQTKAEIFQATGMTVGVADASFAIREGEIFVVMGLSGSGKSTLVRMLNRLIEPSAGSVLLDGKDIARMGRRELIETRRRNISMVFQSFALMPHQTVLANAAFGLNVAGIEPSEREPRALQALDAVGLKANAHSYPDELSGGMQQRVGLARALAVDPEVLLMDEAFSALDPLIRTEMQDELLRLQAEHARTVVFITHDLDEAMRVGDRVAIMQAGRVVQVGAPDDIVRNPANDYVRSFFRGVDITRVYRASDIAEVGSIPVFDPHTQTLAAIIERLQRQPQGLAVMRDEQGGYLGTLTLDALRRLAETSDANATIPQAAITRAGAVIPASMGLHAVMRVVADSPLPVPVVDDDNRYLGSISKTRLLQTLNRADEVEETAT